jgi:hypothetical protein
VLVMTKQVPCRAHGSTGARTREVMAMNVFPIFGDDRARDSRIREGISGADGAT